MKRQLIASAAFLALVASPALAQISIPYTFSNLSGNVPASYLDSETSTRWQRKPARFRAVR